MGVELLRTSAGRSSQRLDARESIMKLTSVTPNLITNDIDRATTFYRDVLGFSVVTTVPEAGPFVFVWLQRDDVNVFLNDAATVQKENPDARSLVVGSSGVAMFVHTEQVRDLWTEVQARATVIMPLKDQWYGMREFSIADPDGYVLTFAERIDG
jgi:uncharacterized glyoxalase superfamily protein PhnB